MSVARRLAVPLGLAVLACGPGDEPAPGPPAAIHGAVILEPSTLGVGDLVTVEITVVTPPEHRVRPIELPERIPPLWLLDAERLPIERHGERWTHVTRIRARVQEAPGDYVWPAQTVAIEAPEGAAQTLVLEAQPFTVASVSAEWPGRQEPFGLRAPAAPARGGVIGPALLGSAATLLLLGGLRLVRRLRRREPRRGPAAAGEVEPAWTAADAALGAALSQLDSDPRAAADDAAFALRRYVHRRVQRPIESLTTEEIAAQRAPGRLRSRWPELIDLLRRLDGVRFPGGLDRPEERETLRATLEDARRFVSDSTPPRELR